MGFRQETPLFLSKIEEIPDQVGDDDEEGPE